MKTQRLALLLAALLLLGAAASVGAHSLRSSESSEDAAESSAASAAAESSAAAAASESGSADSEESGAPKDEETAARTVKELTGPKGGKVTIVANKNTLTHVQAEDRPQDFVRIEEEEQKRSDEANEKKKAADDKKAKTEDDAKNVERNRLQKEKEKEEAQKAKEKEEAEKKVKEEGEKKQLEQNAKEAQQKAEQEKKNEERQKEEAKKKEDQEKKDAESKQKKDAEEATKKKAEEDEKKKKAEEEANKKQRVRLEGWTNYQNSYEDNTVTKWGRIVFVEGLIRGNNGFVGTLPDDCRPYDGRLIFSLMHGTVQARVDVLPDGRIYWITNGNSDWLTLNGISFDTNMNNGLELIWGWVSYGSGYRPVMQTQQDGLCMISGLIRSGSYNYMGRSAWCHPYNGQIIFNVNNHNDGTRIDVRTDGYFFRNGGTANHHWVSLDGMAWTTSGGSELSLVNGWNHYYSGYRTGRYERVGKICILSGLIRGNGWGGHATTLPSGCRPRKRIIFTICHHDYASRVDVLPDGQVQFIYDSSGWFSLDGVKFIAYQ